MLYYLVYIFNMAGVVSCLSPESSRGISRTNP